MCFLCLVYPVPNYKVLKLDKSKEKTHYIVQFQYNKCKSAVPFIIEQRDNRFSRFRGRNFDVKNADRLGRPVVENIDKIMEIIQVDRHVTIR